MAIYLGSTKISSAGSSSAVSTDSKAVLYTEQNLTPTEQAQARQNLNIPFITVACFEATADDGASYTCTSHTAQYLFNTVAGGNVVIAILRNQGANTVKQVLCFTDGDNRIALGNAVTDGGWQHCMNLSDYFVNGDTDVREIGNELWVEY